MDVIGTKVLRVFLQTDLTPSPHKNGVKLVCNVNIVYGIKSENSQDYAQKTSTKLYVHEFGFSAREVLREK